MGWGVAPGTWGLTHTAARRLSAADLFRTAGQPKYAEGPVCIECSGRNDTGGGAGGGGGRAVCCAVRADDEAIRWKKSCDGALCLRPHCEKNS